MLLLSMNDPEPGSGPPASGMTGYASGPAGSEAALRHDAFPPYSRAAVELDALGLTRDESLAYRELVAMPSTSPGELAPRLGGDVTEATRLLAALEHKGLAARSGEDTTRFVASPPSVALGALLVERQSAMRVAELELGALEEIYRAAVTDRGAADVVDVVEGPAAIRQRFEQLHRTARHEVLAFVTAPTVAVSAAENTAEDDAVARGVRYRILFERAMLDHEPSTYDSVAGAIAAGERVRVTDSLPLKLLIVDHELAFVPIGPARDSVVGALLIRQSGLLDALGALFEAEWSRGVELVVSADGLREVAPAAIDDTDAQILALLLSGLNDKAVAFQLKMSLRTVQRRVRHLMELAHAETRLQLGWQAARLGWSPSATAEPVEE